MSDFFADTKFESLDFLAQAIAPYAGSWIDAYATVPKQIPVTLDDFSCNQYYTSSLNIPDIAKFCMMRYGVSESAARVLGNRRFIVRTDNTPIKIIKRDGIVSIDGELFLTKVKDDISTEIIVEILRRESNHVMRGNITLRESNISRIKKIYDIIKNPEDKKFKSSLTVTNMYYKLEHIIDMLIVNDTWQIRNVDLVVNLPKWIRDYATIGNLPSLVNLTKLKIMTHSKLPIYSIKECE
jgi:hypothetical protein